MALENVIHILSLVLQTACRCMICTSVTLYMLYTGFLKSKEAVWCDGASLGYNSKTVSKNKTKQNKKGKTTRNLQQLMDAQTQAGEARSTGA